MAKAGNPSEPPSIIVPFRLAPDLVRRLDRLAERKRKELAGLRVTRADVVRMLLVRGLDEEERRGSR